MDFDRKEFLNALKTAEPALSTRDNIPQLTCFWFTGSVLRATDGHLGIETPLKTDFQGGVPGRTLLGFVDSVGADKIKSKKDDKSVTFSAGSSRVRLPLDEEIKGIWAFPVSNSEPEAALPLDEEWRAAWEHGMLSVTNNSAKVERRGVTFDLVEDERLHLYSTDGETMAWGNMPMPELWDTDRFTAPGQFILAALKVAADSKTEFQVYSSYLVAKAENGINVFSRTLAVEEPAEYLKTLRKYDLLTWNEAETIPIPEEFTKALNRVGLLKDDKYGVPAKLALTAKGVLTIEANSTFGELDEMIKLPAGQYDPINANFQPSALLRGLDNGGNMLITDRYVALVGKKNLMYLVSAYAGAKRNQSK